MEFTVRATELKILWDKVCLAILMQSYIIFSNGENHLIKCKNNTHLQTVVGM